MSDIKISQLNGDKVNEIVGTSADIEKSLQTLIENHAVLFCLQADQKFCLHRGTSNRSETAGLC